jgi:DNA-directed RNA polymerase specialized sigma24 family protein
MHCSELDVKRFEQMKEHMMTISTLRGASPFDSDYDANEIEEILGQNEDYILALARDKVPRHIASPEVLDLEIHELAQRTRIKLWRTLQKSRITHIKAYIRCIVHSASMDMIRGFKPDLPLPLDEEGELYQGNVLLAPGEGMQDPLYELEQKESIAEYITQVVAILHTLPPCQRRVMICSLKDQLDDVSTLAQVCKNFEIDIEAVKWPSKKKEVLNLRASLSITRKKLRAIKRKFEPVE